MLGFYDYGWKVIPQISLFTLDFNTKAAILNL